MSQAQAALLEEVDQTRKEYAKAQLIIAQRDTLINHLKDEEAKKDAIIQQLQEDVKHIQLLRQTDVEVSRDESKTAQQELEFRIKYLELDAARLKEENNIFHRFEAENREIRQTVISQQEQIERMQKINEDLRSRARDDLAEYRQQLEEEFKRRLAESEERFQKEAYRALSEEAKLALQGSDHLQTILQKQNDSIEGVLARCKQLESSHAKIKIEQELSQQSIELHQQEVHKLHKQLQDSRTRCKQLEESLKQRRVERASLELLYMEYETTRKDLIKTQEELRKQRRIAERWRQRHSALQTTHDTSGASTFKADRLEERAELWRSLPKAQPSSAPGLTRSASADDLLHASRNQMRVDPIEMLSLFNVNFESWKPQNGREPSISSNVPVTTTAYHSQRFADEIAASVEPAAQTTVGEAAASAGVAAPPARHTTTTRTPTKPRLKADQERMERDQKMSVLSKRQFKNLPPQGRTAAQTAQGSQFTVAQGTMSFATRPQPGMRHLVP